MVDTLVLRLSDQVLLAAQNQKKLSGQVQTKAGSPSGALHLPMLDCTVGLMQPVTELGLSVDCRPRDHL